MHDQKVLTADVKDSWGTKMKSIQGPGSVQAGTLSSFTGTLNGNTCLLKKKYFSFRAVVTEKQLLVSGFRIVTKNHILYLFNDFPNPPWKASKIQSPSGVFIRI